MNQRGFAPIIIILIILGVLIVGGGVVYYVVNKVSTPVGISPTPIPSPVACTQEAKQCPDGSYVGRTGPHCEFAACPNKVISLDCKSDADCPSSSYTCEAIEGTGTVYPNNSQPPVYTITKGQCKLTVGNKCSVDSDCSSGLLCHSGVCTNPVGNQCGGTNDGSCPNGYQCIQACGPPVSRPGDPPPPYYCELNEIANKPRNCPICLASNTQISTPSGNINVRDIKIGTIVWSVNKKGEKINSTVLKTSNTPTPKTHQVVHLVLSNEREVWVSPNHPTINSLTGGELNTGDLYDGSYVVSAELVPYWDNKTYDLLPDSDTGYYFANGILLGSTLK